VQRAGVKYPFLKNTGSVSVNRSLLWIKLFDPGKWQNVNQ
jgi:hypothetical protein